jgi:hypothetical protein
VRLRGGCRHVGTWRAPSRRESGEVGWLGDTSRGSREPGAGRAVRGTRGRLRHHASRRSWGAPERAGPTACRPRRWGPCAAGVGEIRRPGPSRDRRTARSGPHTEGGSPYATVSQRSIAGTRTVEVRAVEHPGCEPLHLEAGDGPPLTAHQTGPGLLGEPEDPGESDRRTRRRRCPARPATEHLVDLGAVHGGRGVAFVAATS